MPLRQVLNLLLNAVVLIVFACETNFVVAANVISKRALKPTTQTNLRLQPSYALAFPPDDDDCPDDYIGEIFDYAKREDMPTDLPKIQLAMLHRIDKAAEGFSKTEYLSDDKTFSLVQKEQLPASHVKSQVPIKVITAMPPIETVAAAATEWEIKLADKTLNSAIARWSVQAGWQLLWELPVDYAVEANTTVPGSFERAIETVAQSMEGAEIPMKAIFYKGNKVLRIVQKGVK